MDKEMAIVCLLKYPLLFSGQIFYFILRFLVYFTWLKLVSRHQARLKYLKHILMLI